MTLDVDLFWSFRSPYSYLVTSRMVALQREFDVNVHARPVYPIAVRLPGFLSSTNPQWIPYLLNDIQRIADMNGVPLGWPDPDPVVIDPQTREAADEQPYIHRLTRLGVAAAEKGQGLPFLDAVSRMIWSGDIKGWDKGDHLAKATAAAGLDLAALEAEIAADTARFDALIEKNQSAHHEAGHWGVPLMAFKGEPFFGQDRFDVLKWRLEQNGLTRRG